MEAVKGSRREYFTGDLLGSPAALGHLSGLVSTNAAV
jgi:hypothetical protein